ncbi:Protein-S-isoprenylcysteine O-methyltransferase [Sarcoptes scabiei]|uniref:Protein-S-isoprenylcysteine O-methyltransferase n=1 Tax=Sarcoptes scabiei TaxID=52283 RepID=A0A834R858_SARSC|nr:Protein-S-isoprenylcysteine O-methyltransferase [Sarcoptes scabiei]
MDFNIQLKRKAISVSIQTFLGPALISIISLCLYYQCSFSRTMNYHFLPLLAIFIIISISLMIPHQSNFHLILVMLQSSFLSLVLLFGLHLSIANSSDSIRSNLPLGLYLIILSLFHYGEFITIALSNLENLKTDSFLINHSVEYISAITFSIVEFILESWFLPRIKFIGYPSLNCLGFSICLLGDGVRKLAMITAGQNFNHHVQTDHKPSHHLVTDGIYSIVRHPSYAGWFYWCIGAQILLNNPIGFVLSTIIAWLFFNERIRFEEITLVKFFGRNYIDYKQKVHLSGIPWINGNSD